MNLEYYEKVATTEIVIYMSKSVDPLFWSQQLVFSLDGGDSIFLVFTGIYSPDKELLGYRHGDTYVKNEEGAIKYAREFVEEMAIIRLRC